MNRKNLILLAALVWMMAGSMVIKTGVSAYSSNDFKFIYLAISLLVFGLFFFKIFSPLATKNKNRIMNLEHNQVKIWKFLDKKGYLIMAFMMTFGILLRKSGLVRDLYIFIFYLGLGVALFSAGVKYMYLYFKEGKNYAKEDVL